MVFLLVIHLSKVIFFSGVFMELPSKKNYPDYYDIISEPIDMKEIDNKIKTNQYKTEEEMISDCKLMFSNCRLYNEEGSAIYEDANVLERVLLAKAREIGALSGDRLVILTKRVWFIECCFDKSLPISNIDKQFLLMFKEYLIYTTYFITD